MARKVKKMKLPQQKASQNKKHSKSPKNISPKKIIETEEKKENQLLNLVYCMCIEGRNIIYQT